VPGNMTLTFGANDQATVTFSAPIFANFDTNPGFHSIEFNCNANNGSTLTVSGTPPGQEYTGGTFKLGTSTITCSASEVFRGDTVGTPAFVTVTVNDQPASFFNVPNTITVDATSPNGAVVTYTAPTASESGETENFPVTCTPASGSTFAITAPGNFDTVTCSATDPDGSTSTASFMVHVSGRLRR